MDRINELQSIDEPLSTNTEASVEVGSSNDQNGQLNRAVQRLTLREDYPKRDQPFFERLQTYANFPTDCPVTPEQLSLAGFRYVDHAGTDMVRCDYCHGRLQRWEESDQPIHEHARHYPNCDFLLPLMQAEKNPNWNSYETRLSSFNTEYWNLNRTPRPSQLAEAGFHFVGGMEIGRNLPPGEIQERPTYRQDATKCFHCDTTLHSWEESDDVWVEHAKWSSKCGFLIAQRGLNFVRQNSRRVEVGSTEPNFDDINIYDLIRTSQSEMRMNRTRIIPEAEMVNANIKTADLHRKAEKLPEPKSDDLSQCYEDLLKTVQCKVCLSARSSILFLPCSHISVCPECARQLSEDKCPICREHIQYRIDAFIS